MMPTYTVITGTLRVLTLNMLNRFKDHIFSSFESYLGFGFTPVDEITLEPQYTLSVQHSQYHACWCSGDFRSQGTNRHAIDLQSRNIPSPAWEKLMLNHNISHAMTVYDVSRSTHYNACLRPSIFFPSLTHEAIPMPSNAVGRGKQGWIDSI